MANLLTRTACSVMDWVNARAPGLAPMYRKHMSEYYAPKNFNLWYYFGSLALLVLVNQIVTGIFLTMHYNPSAAGAFDSVEYIMRDVDWGWLIRYMHSTGASLFFIVVYLHMFRGLMYGSYRKPRELVWLLGMVIYLVLMAEAFMGYVLPWGQMSYWGAKVIISLFGAIPVVGPGLTEWIMGDYNPGDATLNRFFALHVIALPLVLLLLVVLHLGALHEVGSNNPDGIEIKKGPKGNRWSPDAPADGIPFHPYYTVKDLFGAGFFLILAAFIIFFAPTFGGWFLEHDNFTQANPLVTPAGGRAAAAGGRRRRGRLRHRNAARPRPRPTRTARARAETAAHPRHRLPAAAVPPAAPCPARSRARRSRPPPRPAPPPPG